MDLLSSLERRLERSNQAPTFPIYAPSDMPQDGVPGQVAIGTDDALYWFSNGAWYNQPSANPILGSLPQDPVEGQVVVGTTSLCWFSNGAWHGYYGKVITGNPPQDAISGQLALGNTNNMCWFWEGNWYSFWTPIASPVLPMIVIAGQDFAGVSRIITSQDAITWSLQSDPAYNGRGWGVTYSPELDLFVMVCDGNAMTSPDGVTWSNVSVPFSGGQGFDVEWSAALGIFVAAGHNAGFTTHIATSPNGVTWTPRTTPFDGFSVLGVAWSPTLGQFLGLGSGDDSFGPAPVIMTSPNGITWTAHGSPMDDGDTHAAAWSPTLGLWAAVGSGGGFSIMTSPNGTAWTSRVSGGIGGKVIWVQTLGMFVAVAQSTWFAGKAVATSTDGITWIGRTTPFNADGAYSVTWSETLGLLIAVAAAHARIYTSPDSINWTQQTATPSLQFTQDVVANR